MFPHTRLHKSQRQQNAPCPPALGDHNLVDAFKASMIYRRTKNLRAVQLLVGHTKLENTVRYLGIEIEDALEVAEQTEV